MTRITVPEQPIVENTVVGATPQTAFPFSFNFQDLAGFIVEDFKDPDNPSQITSFSVVGNPGTQGGYAGGTLTLTTAVSNTTIRITRQTQRSRNNNITETARFPVGEANNDWNRQMMLIQEVDAALRSADVPGPDISTSYVLAQGATQSRVLSAHEGRFLTPYDFGAQPGVDSSTQIQAMLDANNYTLDGLMETWRIDALLTSCTKSHYLRNFIFDLSQGPNDARIEFIGSLGTADTTVTSITAGSDLMNCADSSLYAKDQRLFVISADLFAPGHAVPFSEFPQVKEIVSPTQVRMTGAFRYSYSTTITVYRPAWLQNLVLENCYIIGKGDGGNNTGFRVELCEAPVVHGVRGRNVARTLVNLRRCMDIDVAGCVLRNGDNSAGIAYTVATEGCGLGTIARTGILNGRHAVTLGGTQGVNYGIDVVDTYGAELANALVDAHPAADECVFDGGIGIFNHPDSSINTLDGAVYQGASGTIRNFTFFGPGRHAVLLQPTSAQQNEVFRVAENVCVNWGRYTATSCAAVSCGILKPSGSIYALYLQGQGASSDTLTTGFVVNTTGAGAGVVIERIVFDGDFSELTNRGIEVITGAGRKITQIVCRGSYHCTQSNAPVVHFSSGAQDDIQDVVFDFDLVAGGNVGIRNTMSGPVRGHCRRNTSPAPTLGNVHWHSGRYLTTERTALTAVEEGFSCFDITDKKQYVWDGTVWQPTF